MSSFSPYPHSTAFEQALAFLDKGRKSKMTRRVKQNTRLVRTGEDDIALVLHQTAVVTYHRDGTQTIYGGGWNTPTTKQRISEFSAARPNSDGKGSWIVGYTGLYTAPRVQKCRTCKGKPRWIEQDYCYGPSQWGPTWCSGGSEQYRVPIGQDGWWDSRYTEPCKHGQEKSHATAPCSHGEWERHRTGESERECYRCKGEGTVDYGSNPIPVTVTADQPYLVDAAGVFIELVDERPSTYAMPCPVAKAKAEAEHQKHLAWLASPEYAKQQAMHSVLHKGSEIVDVLAEVVPGLKDNVKHPIDGGLAPVNSIIVSLNDKHRWSRERIADWLETLDADLRFTPAA